MSAQPEIEFYGSPELRIVTTQEINDRIAELSQMNPADVYQIENEKPEVLFRAAQRGMQSSHDWQKRVEWLGVMYKAVGPHYDY